MFHRLTDFMKNGIDRFLSQELSPEEIEEMRLDEGLRLEDVEKKNAKMDFFSFFEHPLCNNEINIDDDSDFLNFEDPPGCFSHYMDIYRGDVEALAYWGDEESS